MKLLEFFRKIINFLVSWMASSTSSSIINVARLMNKSFSFEIEIFRIISIHFVGYMAKGIVEKKKILKIFFFCFINRLLASINYTVTVRIDIKSSSDFFGTQKKVNTATLAQRQNNHNSYSSKPI